MSEQPVIIGGRWVFPDGTSVPVVSGGDGPEPSPAAAPAAPAPEAPPAVAPVAPEGFVPKDVHDREVADRIRERNLYKPYAQAFAPLDPTEREALLGVAEMVRNGDIEGIVSWSLQTAENVSGKSAAELIAARQQATPTGQASTAPGVPAAAPAAPASEALTADAVQRIIAQTLQQDRTQVQQQAANQQLINEYTQKMTAAGVQPTSEEGREVIEICRGLRGDMDKALRVFALSKADQVAAGAAAAAAAGQVPAPAPNGAPASAAPAVNLSPRDRVIARLSQQSG